MLISSASFAQNDAIDKFFEDYQDNELFTMVYVSPKMFGMISKVAGDEFDGEIADVVKDIKGLKILTTKDTSKDYYKEANRRIDTKGYEVLLTARDKGQKVRFLTKTSGDIVKELLLLVGGGEQEFVLMSFVGNLDLAKIAKLAKKLNIDGVEHLEKLGQE